MPDTICIQERLPAGAAAVLINQSHTYTDLFMPIDSTEKRLFDAIDGNRCVGEIVESTLSSSQQKMQLEIARAFFERFVVRPSGIRCIEIARGNSAFEKQCEVQKVFRLYFAEAGQPLSARNDWMNWKYQAQRVQRERSLYFAFKHPRVPCTQKLVAACRRRLRA